MIDLHKIILFGALAHSVFILSACSSSDSGSSADFSALDAAISAPENGVVLDPAAHLGVLYAIQTRGFESEYGDDVQAPHFYAWERFDMNRYVSDGPYQETYNCSEIAEYQTGVADGEGTFTVTNSMKSDGLGSVEFRYNNCAIGGTVRAGKRRITVIKASDSDQWSMTAAEFRLDYEDYSWGKHQIDYRIDGSLSYKEVSKVGDQYVTHESTYETRSNYTFSSRLATSYEMMDLLTTCTGGYYYESWACNIDSGEVLLDKVGRYEVATTSSFYGSLWADDTKLVVRDGDGNTSYFWSDGAQKHVTTVDTEQAETTYVIAYDSPEVTLLTSEATTATEESVVDVFLHRQGRWEKEMFAPQADEFLFFDSANNQKVDGIRVSDLRERAIDLVDPAYDVLPNSVGDALYSGHDGRRRSLFILDPDLNSTATDIGLGKIIKIHGYDIVTFQVPGETYENTVSYNWDHQNEVAVDLKYLSGGDNVSAFSDAHVAFSYNSGVNFESASSSIYDSQYVDVGRTYGFLKFFNHDLLITGGGVIVKCALACEKDAVYSRSINELIGNKYPDAGEQIVVSAVTDTTLIFQPANVMLVATYPKSKWASDDENKNPEVGMNLWAFDMNDVSRMKKIELPRNDFSTPAVGLSVRELFKGFNGGKYLGVGSWMLDSGRKHTVLFSIDPAEIVFD